MNEQTNDQANERAKVAYDTEWTLVELVFQAKGKYDRLVLRADDPELAKLFHTLSSVARMRINRIHCHDGKDCEVYPVPGGELHRRLDRPCS
jgi:hypothetical protein